jgi:hypothetical protein
VNPLLEEPEPDDPESDEYTPYFAWNPPGSEYDAAEVGSGEN